MQYPVMNSNSKAISLASKDSYSCLYDIVWSFDYAISGSPSTEAGFTVFLMTPGMSLSGGGVGIDLGYSGLSAFNVINTVKPGISGAIIAVGFDTTGLFAASAYSGSFVRDGIDYRTVKKNSITIREGAPNFKYSNYNVSLSSLNNTFTIVESAAIYKTIRARLGNVGRTLYIDYRNNPTEQFQPILEKSVSLNLPVSAFAHAGVSFATPISSFNNNAIGNIFIKNFHIEGSPNPNLYRVDVTSKLKGISLDERKIIPVDNPEIVCLKEPCVTIPPSIVNPFPIRSVGINNVSLNSSLIGGGVAGVNTFDIYKCENIAVLDDLFNFSYKVKVVETDTILTRTDHFTYVDDLGAYTLELVDFNIGWRLNYLGSYFYNNRQIPKGVFTGNQKLSVIYI